MTKSSKQLSAGKSANPSPPTSHPEFRRLDSYFLALILKPPSLNEADNRARAIQKLRIEKKKSVCWNKRLKILKWN